MGISHLEIHTGKTKKIRAQTSAPTDPSPKSGDIYLNTTSGREVIAIYQTSGWIFANAVS